MSKIALITGASRGIGRDIALSLAKDGVHSIITYKSNRDKAQEVCGEIGNFGAKSACLELDLNNFNSLPQFFSQFLETLQTKFGSSKFDFLINNAGIGATVPMEKVTPELFEEFTNIHYKSPYFLSQYSLPYMNQNGRIINISSGTTRFCHPGYSVYASLKGAMEILTKYIAKEYGSKGIGANIVAPGPIETDFNNATIRSNPHIKSALSTATALGRVGLAEDVGGVVAFLCSEKGRWINGQRIEVSGGINI